MRRMMYQNVFSLFLVLSCMHTLVSMEQGPCQKEKRVKDLAARLNLACVQQDADTWYFTHQEGKESVFKGTLGKPVSLESLRPSNKKDDRSQAVAQITSQYHIFLHDPIKDTKDYVAERWNLVDTLLRDIGYHSVLQPLIARIEVTNNLANPGVILYPHPGKETAQKVVDYLYLRFLDEVPRGRWDKAAYWDNSTLISVAQVTALDRKMRSAYFDKTGAYLNKDCTPSKGYPHYEVPPSPYRLVNPAVHVKAIQDGYEHYKTNKKNFYRTLLVGPILLGGCCAASMYYLRTHPYNSFVKQILAGVNIGALLSVCASIVSRWKKYRDTCTSYICWFSQLPDCLQDKKKNESAWSSTRLNHVNIHHNTPDESLRISYCCATQVRISGFSINTFGSHTQYSIGNNTYADLPSGNYYYDYCSEILVKEGGEIVASNR